MNTNNVLKTRLSRRGFGAATIGAISAATLAGNTATVAQDATRITVWGEWSGEGEAQIKGMVDAFNAAHPEIQVEYVVQEDMITKFLTGATSGMVPDVMIWDRWQTALYAPRGVLAPINDYMSRDGVAAADFYEEAVRELSAGDQVYGLPLTVDARALFFNEAHLAEVGGPAADHLGRARGGGGRSDKARWRHAYPGGTLAGRCRSVQHVPPAGGRRDAER